MNSFGKEFVFTSFGESHGRAIGGVLDGVPSGIPIDLDMIRRELDRRSGRSQRCRAGVSLRALDESDEVEWLSGVLDGVTLGTPIAFIIRNTSMRSEDYDWLKHHYRVGHADWVYAHKYGIRDWRGGGRASARETAGRVVAGCIARQLLALRGIHIHAQLVQVGEETREEFFNSYIATIQRQGDSIGGIIQCKVTGLPIGIGEPIFDKLQSHLAYAMMSINACKGFDYGSGFAEVGLLGSKANTMSGGMVGGITDGTPLIFRCVFKPTPSTPKALQALCSDNKQIHHGRFDACVAVRAVPIVEAMTALVLINERL